MNFPRIRFPTRFSSVPPSSPRYMKYSLRKAFSMTTPVSKVPRRFAPLKEDGDKEAEGIPRLKGIVFDVDGTLW